MRGNRRTRKKEGVSLVLYLSIGALIVIIIVFIIIYNVYQNKKITQNELALGNTDKLSSLVENISVSSKEEDVASVVAPLNQSVEEESVSTSKITSNIKSSTQSSSKKTNSINVVSSSKSSVETSAQSSSKPKESKVQLEFIMPVEGEIIREFASENLVYSETLQEWITHTAIDIKANKTTVVKAAEAGVVEAIKNDPRFGLTVIIKHENNFKTVYSNLLTAEFVEENEEVEKGETIATVGNSAVFESADEEHLHFEMLKDGEKVDPTLYIK